MSRELRPYEPGNAYGIAPGSQVQTIDLRRMMVALRRQRTTILAPALLMGALGLIYVKSLPDTYDAFAWKARRRTSPAWCPTWTSRA